MKVLFVSLIFFAGATAFAKSSPKAIGDGKSAYTRAQLQSDEFWEGECKVLAKYVKRDKQPQDSQRAREKNTPSIARPAN